MVRANQNRHLVPWLVVVEPELSRTCLLSDDCLARLDKFNEKLENLFYEYNVDLILETNNNMYTREFPALRYKSRKFSNSNENSFAKRSYENVEMPIRISLPKHKYRRATSTTATTTTAKKTNVVKTSAATAFEYEPRSSNTYGILEVVNSTHLYWIYIFTNETLIDEFHLVKVN